MSTRFITIVRDGQTENIAVFGPLVMEWDAVNEVFLLRADMMSLQHRIWHTVLCADKVMF